jgi:hypothetical protein
MAFITVRAVRPAWTRPGAPVAVLMLAGVVAAVVRAASGNRDVEGLGWWAIPAVGLLVGIPAVIALVYLVLRRRNVRLEIDEGTLSHCDLRGRRTTIDRDRAVSVHDLELKTRMETGRVTVVADQDGTALLSLWHTTWDQQDLTWSWKRLGWPVHVTQRVPVDVARTRFPGLRLPVGFTNPGRTALLAVVGVLGYAVAWVALMVMVM